MWVPIPAGTVTARPLRNTCRWACTWYASCSRRSGTRPAARARASGLGGAGQGGPPRGGNGARAARYAGGAGCVPELVGDFELEPPHPDAVAASAATRARPPPGLAVVVRAGAPGPT